MSLALHIFRRDLRLHDNTALLKTLKQYDNVLPCFIFDPRQIESHPYQSQHALQFMLQSLKELDKALQEAGGRLYYFYGKPEEVVANISEAVQIDAVSINKDYTPFSRQRDKSLEALCFEKSIEFIAEDDALLTVPGSVLTDSGTPYKVYSAFRKKAALQKVALPKKHSATNYFTKKLSCEYTKNPAKEFFTALNEQLRVKGGRAEAKALLKQVKNFSNYKEDRDIPAKAGTSLLSAHHKFGTVSIREVYHVIAKTFGTEHQLIQELYWRDFFTHVAYHFPHVFGNAFRPEYDHILWNKSQKDFQRWCDGKTGFPIVDAGMRELNTTGYMHNRVRMITASFLVKDLHMDWRRGERYFAQQLVDYDPAVNNGNWQWAASTGCDAQPYFRIFNPWRQQERFDSECVYIKKWIPELADYTLKEIHKWKGDGSYPAPMLDHKEKSKQAKAMYEVSKMVHQS